MIVIQKPRQPTLNLADLEQPKLDFQDANTYGTHLAIEYRLMRAIDKDKSVLNGFLVCSQT